jgi:hypothetical protein
VEIAVQNGCMFVMNGLILPAPLRFEGQLYSEGWKLLRSVKSGEIDRPARDCGWNFIFLAEAIRRTVFGFGRAGALRGAMNKLLADARENAFNSLEITTVTTRHFLGLHWVTVVAHFRSLQKSAHLKDVATRRRELTMGQCIPGAERL